VKMWCSSGGVAVQWFNGDGVSVMVLGLRPSLDRVRFCRWVWRLMVILVLRAVDTPPLFIAQCNGGPPTM